MGKGSNSYQKVNYKFVVEGVECLEEVNLIALREEGLFCGSCGVAHELTKSCQMSNSTNAA